MSVEPITLELHPVLVATGADAVPRGPERVAHLSRVARAALRRSAEHCSAELGALRKNDDDAPLPSNGWHWSVSHTHSWAAGAVARSSIGIDVERIEPQRQEVVREVASRAELDLFDGFTWRAFARVWTAKEAVLKKAGCGLSELSGCTVVAVPNSDGIVVGHRDAHHYVHQRYYDEHVCSLSVDPIAGDAAATNAPDVSVRWHWEPHRVG